MNKKNNIEKKENRKFGLLFSLIFCVVAMYFHMTHSADFLVVIFAALSAIFVFIVIIAPDFLSPLYKVWVALGYLLGRIVSPIVLGLIFFLLITPVALLGRIAGRDPLRLKPRAISSYWVKREPAGPTPDSFKNQF